jgi:hypothetical protein
VPRRAGRWGGSECRAVLPAACPEERPSDGALDRHGAAARLEGAGPLPLRLDRVITVHNAQKGIVPAPVIAVARQPPAPLSVTATPARPFFSALMQPDRVRLPAPMQPTAVSCLAVYWPGWSRARFDTVAVLVSVSGSVGISTTTAVRDCPAWRSPNSHETAPGRLKDAPTTAVHGLNPKP